MALLFDQNQGSFQDTGSQRSPVKKNTGIMRKEMSKLDEVAPRGHTLAYITPEEARILNRGGGGVDQEGNQMMGPYGVPMYPGYGSKGYQGAGKASGGDIGYGSQTNKSSSQSNQSSNNNQPYESPKKNFNTDNFMETVGNSIGKNKETINNGLLTDPGLIKALENKEKGNGILERKGDVSNKIIDHLKTNAPQTEKEQIELLYVVDKFPNIIKNKIKKSVDDGEISLVAKPDKKLKDIVITGTNTGFTGKNLTPKLPTPELMKASGFPFNNLSDMGRLADELASVDGFYGGSFGVRGAIRHAIGASYFTQGNALASAYGHMRIPGVSYPEIATDENLDLWHAKGGPNYSAIDAKYFGKQNMSDFADTINNRVGVDNLSNLSFEKRYEKVKQMTVEQLEYFIETGGEFKKGLPVWDTNAERRGNNTFYQDGIISNVEDAKAQLKVLKEAEENLIDQRRMGLLRQTPEASNMEQLAIVGRNERFTTSLNLRNELREDIKNFKESNKDNLYETKPVKVRGSAVKNIPTEQAKNLQEELARLERRLERVQNRVDTGGVLARNTEDWFDKAMEEQNFLKAGNDWVLKIN